MAHSRKPRRNKIDRQLITYSQKKEDNVVNFPSALSDHFHDSNILSRVSEGDNTDILGMIDTRYESAYDDTQNVGKEIARSERQFKGLFQGQDEWEELDEDDNRIFMQKTLEQVQVVFSHLDSLTSQLDPLLTLIPELTGLHHPREEFSRAKVKELVINYYLKRNKFKSNVLPRWRTNFLKHPSAYIQVSWASDDMEPDFKFDLLDRGSLYIDPHLNTGNIKDAAWVIVEDYMTAYEIEENVREGHWILPHGLEGVSSIHNAPDDETVQRILGKTQFSRARGGDRDELFKIWHYWQAKKKGQPHAYGVVVGGKNGVLARWGGIPFPYKGIPIRGKSYLRDAYKPDGISLVRQYRSIQETYNTFTNLRIDDVLENVKQRVFVFENMFGPQTEEDLNNNQKYIRFSKEFLDQVIQQPGFSIDKFMKSAQGGDSTQHLLSDLQYLKADGKEQTSTHDVFRGNNPQSGATAFQVGEQIQRSLGVFRPIFGQEMTLIEELGEIMTVYIENEDFFGVEKLISFTGPNKYKKTVSNFYSDATTNTHARLVSADEMDIDVTVSVMNQAEKMASNSMRENVINSILESLRHHPELMKSANKVINFPALVMNRLERSGEDLDAILYTEEEQQQQAQQQQQQQQQAIQQQMQMLEAQAKIKGMEAQASEAAKSQGQIAVNQAKAQTEFQTDMEKMLAKIAAELQANMQENQQLFQHNILEMIKEASLERQNAGVSVGHGGNIADPQDTT